MRLSTKRWLLSILIITLSIASLFAYNYGEVLQKSIYFYEAQQAGPLPEWNRVEWRGDATMNDEVLGGWYDAGDHVKFNLPMAYTASMLGWAAYEYQSGFEAVGQWDELSNNLKFALDYFVECNRGTTYVYQVGNGGADHNWWGPVEVIEKEMTRPFYTTTASCVTAQTAAALAIGSLVLDNPVYLENAKELFTMANNKKSDAGYSAASGFYNSWSGFWDELIWAATWLYIATDDNSYLTLAESYIPNLEKEGQASNLIKYTWAHCWDDSHYGAILMLAKLTGKQEYKDFTERHLDWWTPQGYNGQKIAYTSDGLAWLSQWGSLRYATTTAFLAFVYADYTTDLTLKQKYTDFAEAQINYTLGDNKDGRSYVIGFGINPPQHPHHRTAHGSWADSQTVPDYHRHVLYGALVGGPDVGGGYTDDIGDYISNEVACDYNAGFTGCLAKMADSYGGEALGDFPQPEEKEDEFFVEAKLNSSGPTYTEFKILVNNQSAWPARMIKDLNFNIYFDLSEVFAAGKTENDLTVSTNYVEFDVNISPFQKLTDNIYFLNIAFIDGTEIYPGGQSEFSAEVQLRVAAPNGSTFWDASNDHSSIGLTADVVKYTNITLYDGTTKLWGTSPQPEPVYYTLTINSSGAGSGSVMLSPEKSQYAAGEEVELLPVPTPNGSFFEAFTDENGIEVASPIIMNSDKVITANWGLNTMPNWIPYVPTEAQTEINIDTSSLSAEVVLHFNSGGYSVISWGTPVVQGNTIYVNANITMFTGMHLMIMLDLDNTYNLGSLMPGNYTFSFNAHGMPVKKESFTIQSDILPGDVNGDGAVNIVDALIVARYAAGLNPPIIILEAADVNNDKNTDILDALLIARYSAGLISGF